MEVLEKIRHNMGLYMNIASWIGYSVDDINMDSVVGILASTSRETLKKYLSMLSPDFKILFETAPVFKNSKQENIYYIEKFKNLLDSAFDIDKSQLVELKEDYIYTMCDNLEKEIKRKTRNANSEFFPISYNPINDLESLNVWATMDAEDSVEADLNDMKTTLYELFYLCNTYYGSTTETARKQEQRKRDHIFVWCMMGLSFYYDTYMPVYVEDGQKVQHYIHQRSMYSCMDAIALFLLSPFHKGLKDEDVTASDIWESTIDYESYTDNISWVSLKQTE